jgi:surfactin synthase thioesterase subunit
VSRPVTGAGGWLVFPRPNPSARLRLFCFPYAGGGASIYGAWPRGLPDEVEVCAVQLPGREGRLLDEPYSDMAALVAKLGEVLAPYLDRPFAFYGHSNGAVMAHELTRALVREGRRPPVHLWVSGRPAPQLLEDEPPIHALPDAEFRRELRRFKGTPEEILENPEIMELITPMLRADFALSETYAWIPGPPLSVPISAYGGKTDDEVSEAQVAGWREHTSAAFHLRIFPGDHFFVNGDRPLVLEELSRELKGVLARLGPAPRAYA